MDEEQIIALAENAKLFVVRNGDCDVEDLRRFLEFYKAELLKEAGEPFGHVGKDILGRWNLCPAGEGWKDETAIYTSDKVAAAILKATGPLEEEVERLKSEQTELIDRFQNENCGRVHMGEPVISQSIKETVHQWLDIRANENVEIDIDELVKIAQGNLQEEAAQYKDELAMVLRCSADLRSQLAAAQEEILKGKRLLMEEMHRANDRTKVAIDLRDQLAVAQEEIRRLEKIVLSAQNAAIENGAALKSTQDQLAKANQLWQVAQGRCDGLEEKLAKAEQRVAEWQPIETAPKDGTDMLCCGWRYNQPKNDWFHTVCWWNGHGFVDDSGYVDFVTHWMPLPKAPANGASS